MLGLLKKFENKYCIKPLSKLSFQPGDTVVVSTAILDGTKTKIQKFKGVVIQRRHKGSSGETFTVYKLSNGIKVEKTFSINSPNIKSIEVVNCGVVRRAKLFYLRDAKGKKLKIKNKIITKNNSNTIPFDTNTTILTENIDNAMNVTEETLSTDSTSEENVVSNTSDTNVEDNTSTTNVEDNTSTTHTSQEKI